MPKKVLIIEDETVISEMYSLKLSLHGYKVATATNGAEGIGLIRSFRPDIILLDYFMPEENGNEVLRKINKLPEAKHARIFMLTNTDRQDAVDNPISKRIQDYIVKANITPAQLLDIIENTSSINPGETAQVI